MTSLGQRCGRALLLPISLAMLAAAGGVACSKGGGQSPDAGGGSGGLGGVGARGGFTWGGDSAGNGGSAGTGGAAGTGGGAAGAGGRPAGTCTFDVHHTPSQMIGTVRIVTWTLDVADLTEAHIDFGPSGAAPTMTAPVNLRDPLHRTVLVGMKPSKPYAFRVVATDGAKTCTSADFSFTTGAVPSTVPIITKTMPGTGAAKGFIVTTIGIGGMSTQAMPSAFIFDTDGDVVWWSSAELSNESQGVSRAHLSWDAESLWVMSSTTGKVRRYSMDGATTSDYSNVFSNVQRRPHHDLTVLPDGGIATMTYPVAGTGISGHALVEVEADGTLTVVVADLSTLYPLGNYPNAIHYYPADDSYTLSDRNLNAYLKLKRNGALVWQLGGGANPLGKSLTVVGLDPWKINHGHHLTPDGRFLFFNNGGTTGLTDMPRVLEVKLDETAGTATKTWEYTFSDDAFALGDVERLPNGNVLVTRRGVQEVDRSGAIVQSFSVAVGYADFRTSLYGPPPR